MRPKAIHGTVIGLRHYGPLVILFLEADDGRTIPAMLDHPAFRRVLESEGCSSTELVGRSVAYDGDDLALLD